MAAPSTILAALLIFTCAASAQDQKPGAGLAGAAEKGIRKIHKAFLLEDEILLQMPEPLAAALRAKEGGPAVVAELNGVGIGRVRNQIKTIEGVITTASAAEGAGEAMAGEGIKKLLQTQLAGKAEERGLRQFLLVKTAGIWKKGDTLKVQVLHPEKQEFIFKVGAAKKTAAGKPTPAKPGAEKVRPE